MLLNNDYVKLRALDPEDLEILYQWENNDSLWIHSNTLTPYSRLALRQYISDTQQQDIYQSKQLRLMIEAKGSKAVIGIVDLYDFDFHNSKVGIGILIDGAYRQQKYASHVLKLVEDYVFRFLNIHQLYAYVAADNNASIRLFRAAGYQQAGTLHDWICCNSQFKDAYIYQLIHS